MGGKAAALVDNPLVNPTDEYLADAHDLRPARPGRGREVRRAVRGDHRLGLTPTGRAGRPGTEAGAPARRGCCSGPGLLFLFLFFFFPLYTLFRMSLSAAPSRFSDPVFDWEWANYSNAFSQYGDQFLRSFQYARHRDAARARSSRYPLAYVIAFRGGRFKNCCSASSSCRSSPTS